MEVLGLHPENLSLAWLPTLIALDNQFSWWMVWFLRMGHCQGRQRHGLAKAFLLDEAAYDYFIQ